MLYANQINRNALKLGYSQVIICNMRKGFLSYMLALKAQFRLPICSLIKATIACLKHQWLMQNMSKNREGEDVQADLGLHCSPI